LISLRHYSRMDFNIFIMISFENLHLSIEQG
jgi:hypothetical protein